MQSGPGRCRMMRRGRGFSFGTSANLRRAGAVTAPGLGVAAVTPAPPWTRTACPPSEREARRTPGARSGRGWGPPRPGRRDLARVALYLVFTSYEIRNLYWAQRLAPPLYERVMRRLNDRMISVAQRSQRY